LCIVGLRRRAATLWLLVSALEACSTLGGRALAAILRRRSLVEARSRARCSAAEPRFLEGEEAALVARLPKGLVGEGGLEEVALVFALGSIRFLEEEWEEKRGTGGFLTAEERTKAPGGGGTPQRGTPPRGGAGGAGDPGAPGRRRHAPP